MFDRGSFEVGSSLALALQVHVSRSTISALLGVYIRLLEYPSPLDVSHSQQQVKLTC